jgi:hypothetical protein
MNETEERRQRKKAIRLWLKGVRTFVILKIVPRSRAWLCKCKKRYRKYGWKGLQSRSRKPKRSSHAYSSTIRRLVVQAYRRVQKRPWGLRGVGAVRRELRVTFRLQPTPSTSTLKRVLRERGIFKRRPPSKREAFYPKPRPTPSYTIHAMDWTERFLQGGKKVFAFHTFDLETRGCWQSIFADKTTASVIQHLKTIWKTRWIPQALQMDNDAAFYGSRKVPHLFGRIIRLCLYVGIEPIFIPVGEAERNGDVEQAHRTWDKAVWQQVRFDSVQAAQEFTPQFEQWYMNEYEPPKLKGQTPSEVQCQRPHYRLTATLCRAIPDSLPITAGRIHFIRRVSVDGTIEVLNEHWHISKRLAGEYVWATLWTHRKRLEVFYRSSAKSPLKRIKTFPYMIDELVVPLQPPFKRDTYRRKMFTMP